VRSSTRFLIVLCGLTFFVGLNRPAISDSDEAYYAEAGREMLETGDWLTPQYNYQPRFQKPVLFYWLAAGTYAVTGVHETAARLWSALAGLGLALLTRACAARWYDARTGAMAGAVAATSFGYAAVARLSLPDLPLALLICAAIWATLRAIDEKEAKPSSRWLVGAALAAGLAVLAKGPVGLAIPVIVVLPVVLVEGSWRRIPPRHGAVALLVFGIVAIPWYAVMGIQHGWTYLNGFFIGDNLERFATTRFNDPRPVWYYVPIAIAGLLPWSFLAGALWAPFADLIRRRRRLRPMELRLLLWAALPLLFYTISIGKQPRYILPILPPLAVLLARGIVRSQDDHRDRSLRWGGVAAGLLFLLLALAIFRGRFLLVGTSTSSVIAGLATIGVGGLALVALSAAASRYVPKAIAVVSAVTMAVLPYTIVPPRYRDPAVVMAAEVKARHRPGAAVGSYRVLVRNLIFYTHLPQEDLFNQERLHDLVGRSEPILCVIGEDELHRLERERNVKLRRLAEVEYFNAATAKPRTLISPDRDRDVEKIVLVANY
jgi:4-amino-4-deoxy-L-arabinose transferase-like glycosyltransferase